MASRGGGKQDPINSFQSPSPAFLFFFVFFLLLLPQFLQIRRRGYSFFMDIHGLGTGGEAERRTRARAAAYDECVSVVVVAEWRDNKLGFGLRGSVIKHGVYEVVYSHRLSLSRARKPGSAPTSLLGFIPEVIRIFFF